MPKVITDIPVLQEEELITVHGELVIMAPVSRHRLTKKRLQDTYAPGGSKLAPFQRVYSVGVHPISAIFGLGSKMKWHKLKDFQFPDTEDNTKLHWYCTFTADGTGMKASGTFVPGGVILNWWK